MLKPLAQVLAMLKPLAQPPLAQGRKVAHQNPKVVCVSETKQRCEKERRLQKIVR